MKLWEKTSDKRLSRWTYRIRCPKCDNRKRGVDIYFHDPCPQCGFMIKPIWPPKKSLKNYKEVGQLEITETKFKILGIVVKRNVSFRWIPAVDNHNVVDFVRDEQEQDFYH